MEKRRNKYFSIKLTKFFLKIVGIWLPENANEQFILDILLYVAGISIILSFMFVLMDFYNFQADFNERIYMTCNILTIIIIFFKILVIRLNRKSVYELIEICQTKFWHNDYDEFGIVILQSSESKCLLLITLFMLFALGTACTYAIRSIIENIGKSGTDKLLPFTVWLTETSAKSPYFELLFVFEAILLGYMGICFFCYDIFFCIINVHLAGQFKILQGKLERSCERNDHESSKKDYTNYVTKVRITLFQEFRSCVQLHKTLISYVEKVENIFNPIMLCQVIMSSILMCLAGFQAISDGNSITKRCIFVAYTIGCFFQLLLFTLTSNEIKEESLGVADAAYRAHWYLLPFDKIGQITRNGFLLIILRARRPCCLTAGRFFAVSLETFTKVMSTTISYYTLLRQHGEYV